MAGVVLAVVALPVAGAALAAPGLAVFGFGLGEISVGLGAASTVTTLAVAGLDCRQGFTRDCRIDLAEVGVSAFSSGFGAAAVTAERGVLRLLTGVLGLASSTASLMDTCRSGKTIFET